MALKKELGLLHCSVPSHPYSSSSWTLLSSASGPSAMLFPLPGLLFLLPSLLPLAGSHSPLDSQLGHHFYFFLFIISSKKPFLDPNYHGPGLLWHLCVIHSFNINLLSACYMLNLLSACYMSGTVSGLDTAMKQIEPSTLGRYTSKSHLMYLAS